MTTTPAPCLRLCIFIDSFYPIIGGGETHAALISEALVNRGAQVIVITQRRKKESPWFETHRKVPIYRVAPTEQHRWGKYLMILPGLISLVRHRKKYDAIYVCGLRTLGFPAILAKLLLKKIVVLRAESCDELAGAHLLLNNSGTFSKLLNTLIKLTLKARNRLYRTAHFISISNAITKEFRDCQVPKERIELIYNGIDTEKHHPATRSEPAKIRKRLNLPQDDILVVYTGKLNEGKGLQLLLRTWKRIANELTNIHLILVGSGGNQFLSCESELRRFVAENKLENQVTFTGYVTNVGDYLRACDIFTLPSESESFGLSLAEAMACGLPSVATNVGGMVDILTNEKEGFLFELNEETGLYRALTRLIADPILRLKMGAAGRETIVKRFGIDQIAIEHQAYFQRLLTEQRTLKGQRAPLHDGSK